MSINILAIFFWWLFPDPRVGDCYRDSEHITDPWCTSYIKILGYKDGWYRVRDQSGYESSKTKFTILTLYSKIYSQ